MIFLVSNALWVGWAIHVHAYALLVLQMALVAMNVRGMRKTEK